MSLDTSALRAVDNSFPAIKDQIVTLIRISAGRVTQAYTVTDKRKMIKALGPDDTLLALWTGEWHTDVFQVPNDVLARWKEDLLG